MKNLLGKGLILLMGVVLVFSSCKDDDNSYAIPTSYNFENVSYSGQLDRLGMLAELKSYLSSVTSGETLDGGRLAAMYSNEANIANWTGTYSTKQLRDKTNEAQQAVFDALLSAAATDSENAGTAVDGTAGLIESLDGEKTYFVNAKGVEYAQIIEKGLMGACIMHQQTGVYLEAGKMDVDNTVVIAGEGTKMQHHWDESFGYFGVPTNFPTSTDGVVFWGDYCNDRSELFPMNSTIMNAYLAGRTAILNNDLRARDIQIEAIQHGMVDVATSTAIHYINSAITNFNDPAIRFHALSEAAAFYYSVQFNPNSNATTTEINNTLTLLGGNSNFSEMNFWNADLNDLEAARIAIAESHNWDTSMIDQF